MDKKGRIDPSRLILDTIGIILIAGGSLLVRTSEDPKISIIGGILASIGVGLLALAKLI